LIDKVIAIAEKMNLGKLTIHTACQYIDRIMLLKDDQVLQSESVVSKNNNVITPRQRIVINDSSRSKLVSSQSPRITKKALS